MPLILLLAGAARGGCDAPESAQIVDRATDASLDAWSRLDLPALRAAAEALDESLPCVSEVLGPQDAAAWWRIRALLAFSAGDLAATETALARARQVQPTYVLPTNVVSEQHPLRRMWEAAATRPAPVLAPLPASAEGWLQVDGRRATDAPAAEPYLLQWVQASGAVGLTEVVVPPSVPAYPVPPPDRHRSRHLLIAGGSEGSRRGSRSRRREPCGSTTSPRRPPPGRSRTCATPTAPSPAPRSGCPRSRPASGSVRWWSRTGDPPRGQRSVAVNVAV